MNIYRVIGMKTYEFALNSNELYTAYREQQQKFDEADVLDYLRDTIEDDKCCMRVFGVTMDEFAALIPDIAATMRSLMSNGWDKLSALEAAAKSEIASRKEAKAG